jgi:hypothetical protein
MQPINNIALTLQANDMKPNAIEEIAMYISVT